MHPVMTFQALWPITDEDMTLRQLAAVGLADLPQLATDADAVLIGRPVWRVVNGEDGRPWLQALAPAWPARSHLPHLAVANDAAARGESLDPDTAACGREGCGRYAGRSGLCTTHRAQTTRARNAA